MRKLLLLTAALLLLAGAGAALASCSGDEKGDETSMSSYDPTTAGSTAGGLPEPVPLPDGEPAVLRSGESELTLIGEETALILRSLITPAGVNVAAGDSRFAFPVQTGKDGRKYVADWHYLSAAMTDRGKTVEASFRYEDRSGSGAILTVTVVAHTDVTGPFEFVSRLENTSDGILRIMPGNFASARLTAGEDAYIMAVKKESGQAEGYTHYDGGFFEGSGIYRDPVSPSLKKTVWCNTDQNWNAGGWLPMVYLQGDRVGAYCALEWSSGAVSVQGYEDGSVGMAVHMDGISVNATLPIFATDVPGGQTFLFPTVYYGAYDGGNVDSGSNLFKKWFFAIKVPDNLRVNPAEPLSQMDMQIGLAAAELNIDAIKWDYGWWSNDPGGSVGNWSSYEGSWVVRNQSYLDAIRSEGCTSLRRFCSKADTLGLSLTTYLLLHDTLDSEGKVTDREGEFNSLTHPDWFSDRRIDDGMGRSADLGNEECVAYLQKTMAEFFRTNGVTTWRSDFEPISRSSNLKNRHDANGSDVQYWCTTGFKELTGYLIENVEGFRYESCSSGGSMKDLFTATLATVINCDDAANYLSMRMTFYDSSYVIHPAQLQLPCNMDFFNPSKAIFHPEVSSSTAESDYNHYRDTMLDMGFRSQLLGVPMFSSWEGTVLRNYLKEYATIYEEKVRPLVREGDLYHVLPGPDGVNWDGVMYADPDSKNGIKGALFLFKPSEGAEDTRTIRLEGLIPTASTDLPLRIGASRTVPSREAN